MNLLHYTVAIAFSTCLGFAASDFSGSKACASCHAAEYRSHRNSHHALALQRTLESPIAAKLIAQPVAERNGVRFDYKRVNGGLEVTGRAGEREISALLEWAFGAGAQGITPVGRVDGRYLEHRISWYTSAGHPAITVGHPAQAPGDLRAVLGQAQSAGTIFRCFNCHATAVRTGPDLTDMQPGVQCERCHGPGREHTAKPSLRSIRTHTRDSASEVLQFCGECHRAPVYNAAKPELDRPESVRFAPIGLTASRCYQASGTLSCVTCHNPHEDARKDSAFYTAKCLGCHADSVPAASRCGRSTKQDCLPCHMPRSRAVPPLEFTDHRIRVLRAASEVESQSQPVDRALTAGDFAGARRLLDHLPSETPRWHLLASKVFDGLNDPARAVAEAQLALDLNQKDEAAWLQLGQVFLTHNTPQPALEVFAEGQQIFPDSLLLRLGKGLALKNLQRYDEAARELRAGLLVNPRLGLAFDALAAIYLQLSDYDRLAPLSKEFLRANAGDYRGYYYLAAAKEGQKQDMTETENALRESIRLNPNFAAAHALLGKIFLATGRTDQSARTLEEAIRLRPDYAPAHLYLANAYRKLGRADSAAREFATVRALKEKEQQPTPALLYHRGQSKK